MTNDSTDKINKTDEEWQATLTPEQYKVMRQGGTEMAFTGEYVHNKESGEYHCAGCGQALFASDTKYESGSGWPSYWQPLTDADIIEVTDNSHGMIRTEAKCGRCDAHLGHVFPDGPQPTGLRYCINSTSLQFSSEQDG